MSTTVANPTSAADDLPPAVDDLDALPQPAKRKRLAMSRVIGPLVLLAVFIGLWYLMHYWGLRFVFDKAASSCVPTPPQVCPDAPSSTDQPQPLHRGHQVDRHRRVRRSG